jgi:hypothetical protein
VNENKAPGVHLPVVHVTCPSNHRFGSQKPGGGQARCPRCFEKGKTVLVTVPFRDGERVPQTRLACPFGHAISTDMPPGSEVKCGQCRRETGDVVTVTLPGGPPPDLPAPGEPESTQRAGCKRCKAWSRCPAGTGLPPGWLMLTVGVDPSADPASRTSRTLGPFCGLVCATIALNGRRTGPEHLRTLMTEPPAGRDR